MNIDELHRAGRSRDEEDRPLRALIESVPVMMGVVELIADDTDVLHVYDSPATERFFGVGRGLTAGKTARELGVPPEAIAMWVDHYRESERLGGPVRFEYPTLKNGVRLGFPRW